MAVCETKIGDGIYGELPFVASLQDGRFWVVGGSLPENTLGGTAVAVIRKSDGAMSTTEGRSDRDMMVLYFG
jgi:hypothetical protein